MSERQQEPAVESVSPDELVLTGGFQVMDDLDDDTYQSLKVSIETDGFDESTPIVVDEENVVLDGHHRLQAAQEADLGAVPVVRKAGLSDEEKRDVAYGHNMRRRNLAGGEKRAVVANYLQEEFDPDTQTQTDVANILGVSAATVSRARNEIEEEEGVDIFQVKSDRRSNAEKREDIREHLDETPDASNRSVADAVDVSKTTVKSVRETLPDGDPGHSDGTEETSPPDVVSSEQDTAHKADRDRTDSAPTPAPSPSGGSPSPGRPQATALEGGSKAEELSTGGIMGSGPDADPAGVFGGDGEREPPGETTGTDGPATPSIRFADGPARDRLDDHGVVVIFRTGVVPTGPATRVSAGDDEPEGEVLVGECGTVDPRTGVAPYVDLSGYGSAEEWRDSMGDVPESGTLYLVVRDA